MAISNFLVFNPDQNNQETDLEYLGDTLRANGGAVDEIVPSPLFNKVLHQASTMAAAVAAFMVTRGQNASDASLSTLTTNLIAALETLIGASFLGTSGGTANAQTLTPAIPLAGYVTGAAFSFIAGFSNTGPTTINISGLGPINVYAKTATGPAPLIGGEIVAGNIVSISYDGSEFQIEELPGVPSCSLANPGYYILPGGLIIQWGFVNFGSIETEGLTGPYSFPIPFPHACFTLLLSTLTPEFTGSPSLGDNVMMMSVANQPTTSQFWVWNNQVAESSVSTDGAQGFSWLAIGN